MEQWAWRLGEGYSLSGTMGLEIGGGVFSEWNNGPGGVCGGVFSEWNNGPGGGEGDSLSGTVGLEVGGGGILMRLG